MTKDPTYVRDQIDAHPIWKLAFRMSEFNNDNAPIGWGEYIPLASWMRQQLVAERRGAFRAGNAAEQLVGGEWSFDIAESGWEKAFDAYAERRRREEATP